MRSSTCAARVTSELKVQIYPNDVLHTSGSYIHCVQLQAVARHNLYKKHQGTDSFTPCRHILAVVGDRQERMSETCG